MREGLKKPESRKGRILDRIYNIVTLGGRIPCVVLIVYTLAGGLIFRYLEMGEDVRRRQQYAESSEWAVNQMLDRMLEVKCLDRQIRKNRDEQIRHAKDAIYWFLDHLNLTEVIAARSEETPWSLLGSMFYAGQLYTTIGYGIPTTQTREGQMVSIFYILFGIPIFLVALKSVGQSLSTALKRAYRRLRRHKKAQCKDGNELEKSGGKAMDEEEKAKRRAANKLSTMLTQIPIAFGLLLTWILLSACLLTCWETQWGLTTSVYFYFVSISTVGLGDIIPTNSDMLVVNFLLILIGLFMLSMCLNLLQTLIENLWSLLIREYIIEMEVMALEGKEEGGPEEEAAATFEMGILGKLIRLPVIEHRTHGMMGVAKHWMAEKVATEVIGRQLESDPDSDSDEEEDEEELIEDKEERSEWNEGVMELNVEDSPRLHMAHIESRSPIMRKHSRSHNGSVRLLRQSSVMQNRALFNRIQTLERLRPNRNDFKSMIFSKILASDQLHKLVEENENRLRVKSIGVQTDNGFNGENGGSVIKRRPGSMISTVSSNGSFIMDEERYLLLGYDDLKIGEYANSDESPMHAILQQYVEEFKEKRRSRLLNMSRRCSMQENRLIEEVEDWSPMSPSTAPSTTLSSPQHILTDSLAPPTPSVMLDSGYGREGESSVSESVQRNHSDIKEEVDEGTTKIQWKHTLNGDPSA